MNDEKITEARKMLCQHLRELAKEKNISQEEIAGKTGFKQQNVSRVLSGKYAPTLDVFIKIAESVDAYFFVIDKNADDELCELMRNRWVQNKNVN